MRVSQHLCAHHPWTMKPHNIIPLRGAVNLACPARIPNSCRSIPQTKIIASPLLYANPWLCRETFGGDIWAFLPLGSYILQSSGSCVILKYSSERVKLSSYERICLGVFSACLSCVCMILGKIMFAETYFFISEERRWISHTVATINFLIVATKPDQGPVSPDCTIVLVL